ncbi:MAG: tripartite tricarboxylate transporter substrate binding protein [Rhodothermales bacterium]|nr:tripartite tricarboxylate transporter substrate binding protein [Rhodothermales bacterium]
MKTRLNNSFRKLRLMALGVLVGLGTAVPQAWAAGLPFRDGEVIRLVVPFGPGGGFDRILRLIQPHFESALNSMDSSKKVTVIVENRKGAGGRVAYEYVYNSPPDGTRIVLMGDQGAALQQLALGANFDVGKFTYLARVNSSDWGILVRKETGITTMNEFIERANQEPILFGSSGAGSGDHIASVIIQSMLEKEGVKLPLTHVHFGSSKKVLASMQRGESEAYVGSVESVLPAVKDGYAVMSVVFAKDRSAFYPDVPTIFEQKVPAAEEIASAIGISRVLVGPPGIPADRRDALVEGLRMALTSSELAAAAKKAKLPVIYGDPEEARAAVKAHSAGLVAYEDLVRKIVKGE